MTIPAGSIKHIYNGTGSIRDWDFTFPIITTDGSDIKLYKAAIDGTVTEITSNYSVNVAGSYVTYPTIVSGLPMLIAGEKITLIRTEALSQAADWVNKGPFNAETVEAALDKITAILQQQDEELSRAIKYAVDQTPTTDDTEAFIAILEALVAAATTAKDAAVVAQGLAVAAKNSADADVVLTHADVVLTHADVVLTHADAVQTALDRIATGADRTQTALDRIATGQDKVATNADVVLTHADVVLTHADVVLTHADVVLTNADAAQTALDRIATGADVISTAAYAAALKGTSVTSNTIGTGAKTFTTQASKQFAVGQFILIVDGDNSANFMHGQVTSYSGTSLVVDVQSIGGSGTKTNWLISVSGSRGAIGATGATGTIFIAAAAGTADAITADYTPDISLADLTLVAFIATAANATTTPTFAPDGLTAHTIVKKGGAALVAGDIPGAGAVCLLEYNLANTRWELLNPSPMVYGDSRFKVVTITRAMDAATGTVAYTGLGFKPKALIAVAGVSTAKLIYACWGITDGATSGNLSYYSALGDEQLYTDLIGMYESASLSQRAQLNSLDTDGFTLDWLRTGTTSAGSGEIKILALR